MSLQSAVKELPSARILLAQEFENGPKIDPLKIIQIYDAGEWETFIDEWVHSLTSTYVSVMRPTGAGDKGIDIAGFCDADQLLGTWDNHQCKHYNAPLSFGVVAPEVGKMLWYSYSGEYKAPRACRFIAPKGASTSLSLLLTNADKLKKKILVDWDKTISSKITSTGPIQLDGKFLEYVENFDFRIFSAVAPRSIIEAHGKTPYYLGRFGGGLPSRPRPDAVPAEIEATEATYTSKLLDAYSEHKGEVVGAVANIEKWANLKSHFQRSREAFYHAESLRVFVREKVEPGTYEGLQTEILEGVLDTYDGEHADGFARVIAVTDKAQSLVLDAHPLNKSAMPTDRRGICHQLANDGKLTWRR
ncbi:ABC-three component system protein [Rhizobium laguerreae]|uniref:ABC-three component system protein n=1 Tax=Rhizobium laguerreae TaxID=1076926 RepID=UPI001FD34FA8|nr:ABC-three component system protein [Rhizobium laguerreae]